VGLTLFLDAIDLGQIICLSLLLGTMTVLSLSRLCAGAAQMHLEHDSAENQTDFHPASVDGFQADEKLAGPS
jgi:hypothetical protein